MNTWLNSEWKQEFELNFKIDFKPQREAYLEEERLWVEAARGSGVASSPEPDQEARGGEMATKIWERETNGEKVEFAEKLRGRGWVSVFGKTRKRRVLHQSSMLCNGLRVISRLELCPQFIFQLNYENDVKIWLLKLFLQK